MENEKKFSNYIYKYMICKYVLYVYRVVGKWKITNSFFLNTFWTKYDIHGISAIFVFFWKFKRNWHTFEDCGSHRTEKSHRLLWMMICTKFHNHNFIMSIKCILYSFTGSFIRFYWEIFCSKCIQKFGLYSFTQ